MGSAWQRCLGQPAASGGGTEVFCKHMVCGGWLQQTQLCCAWWQEACKPQTSLLMGLGSQRDRSSHKEWGPCQHCGRMDRENKNNKRQELAFIGPSSVLGLGLRRT